MVQIVSLQELSDIWPKAEGWIQKALLYGPGDENTRDILIRLARGDYQLWYEEGKFAAVVQFVIHPRQRVATILYCGGDDLSAVKAAFDYGKAWGADNGVDVIRVYGRAGWERALGLKRVGIVCQVAVRTP